ncbi:ski2-like helicase [compost metagenome]
MIDTTPDRLVEAFQAGQPFPLDPFQLDAIRELASGNSVLVSAPTGSGKTVVAEFAVYLALQQGKRCIYTTPLKALSNQKYRDLKAALPGQVGLVTGDVVIDRDAPILIMTTEILRNMLHMDPGSVADVSQVVLDEAHYIAAEGRGTVWEETIVFLGKQTTVTALSATIPNADELATWVSQVHKPMTVILHAERPVPLESYVATPGVTKLFNQHGRLALKRFSQDGWVEPPDAVTVVKDLKEKKMLPAIYFVFSRMGCEAQAKDVIAADLELTTPDERRQIEEMVKEAVEATPGMLGSVNTKRWLDLLPYGAAPHHAGLLPPLKFLIERLFQKALIKVVFATETLAAGINMPARTVVMATLIKRTDDGHRMLAASEFHQMMGRAGRRGMDPVGYGVVLSSHRYGPIEVGQLVRAQAEPLRSRFTLNFNMVINLHHRYESDMARRIVEQSFSQFQSSDAANRLIELRRRAIEKRDKVQIRNPQTGESIGLDLFEEHQVLRNQRDSLRKRLSAMVSERQYLARESAIAILNQTPIGGWLLVHRGGMPAPQIAVLLDRQQVKSGDMQYTVLVEPRTLARLGTRHLVMAVPVAPATGIPPEVMQKAGRLSYQQEHSTGDYHPTWNEWKEETGLDLDALLAPITEPEQITKARAKLKALLKEIEEHPATPCVKNKRCMDHVKLSQLLDGEIARYDQEIEAIHSNHWRQFQALVRFLEDSGYVRGRELLARGVALANLRTTNELVASEALTSELMLTLTPALLAAATSMIVAEPIRGRMFWRPMRFDPQLGLLVDELAKTTKGLYKALKRHGLEDLPLNVVTDYVGLTQAWAEGRVWAELIEESGIDEGQLVRHFRQVIDMLQQFRDVPGVPASFHTKAREAMLLIDRDIVREVF